MLGGEEDCIGNGDRRSDVNECFSGKRINGSAGWEERWIKRAKINKQWRLKFFKFLRARFRRHQTLTKKAFIYWLFLWDESTKLEVNPRQSLNVKYHVWLHVLQNKFIFRDCVWFCNWGRDGKIISLVINGSLLQPVRLSKYVVYAVFTFVLYRLYWVMNWHRNSVFSSALILQT